MDNAKLALNFIEFVGESKDLKGFDLIVKIFEFIEENEQMSDAVGLMDKLATIRNVLSSAIKQLYANNPSQRDEYLLMVNNVFTDTHDIGTLVTLLMKAIEELNKLKKLSGPEKKKLVQTVFNHIIDFSSLDDTEKQLARYAFGGIVEAIIWAKHGGLAQTKKSCFLLCK